MRQQTVRHINRLFSSLGLSVRRRHSFREPALHLARKCEEFGISTILDIGANVGQFGRRVRDAGYRGQLVSFEPLDMAHSSLTSAAGGDRSWTVMPPMALGSTAGKAKINVSSNLSSSSLLAVDQRSIDAFPRSAFVRTEDIDIRRLDTVTSPLWSQPYALKIDTQGFEIEVLSGAENILPQVKLVLIEMSLCPLYEGAPLLAEVYSWLEQRGFRCIGLTEGFVDLDRQEMLQVDGLFTRD